MGDGLAYVKHQLPHLVLEGERLRVPVGGIQVGAFQHCQPLYKISQINI